MFLKVIVWWRKNIFLINIFFWLLGGVKRVYEDELKDDMMDIWMLFECCYYSSSVILVYVRGSYMMWLVYLVV